MAKRSRRLKKSKSPRSRAVMAKPLDVSDGNSRRNGQQSISDWSGSDGPIGAYILAESERTLAAYRSQPNLVLEHANHEEDTAVRGGDGGTGTLLRRKGNSRFEPTAASIPTPWSPSAAGWMSASPSPSASAPACGISSRRYLAHNLARWTARIGLGQQIVTTKTLRRRFFALAGRLTRSARRITLHLPKRWPWEERFSRALARLRAIPLPA